MSKGQVAGLISGIVTILTAFGLSDVAGIIQNPLVGFAITSAVGAIGSVIAGHLPGKKA